MCKRNVNGNERGMVAVQSPPPPPSLVHLSPHHILSFVLFTPFLPTFQCLHITSSLVYVPLARPWAWLEGRVLGRVQRLVHGTYERFLSRSSSSSSRLAPLGRDTEIAKLSSARTRLKQR